MRRTQSKNRSSWPPKEADLLIIDDVGAEPHTGSPLLTPSAFETQLASDILHEMCEGKRVIWVVGHDPNESRHWVNALVATFERKVGVTAGGDSYVVLAIHRIGHRRCVDTGTGEERPQNLASRCLSRSHTRPIGLAYTSRARLTIAGMSSNNDLEKVLRANLKLRRELAEVAKAVEPVPFGHKILNMKTGVFDRWLERFGRSDH
jgi:hypothetical protein